MMKEFIAKHTIDEYTDNNELNSRIYHILLALQDSSNSMLKPIAVTPLTIFNRAYNLFYYVANEKHPEELVPTIKQKISNEFLAHETDVILSTLCVITSFNTNSNPNMEFFLTRLKSNINPDYWNMFAPILKTELELPSSFDELKSQGDKIDNLTEKELFYNDYLTRYKQAQNRGNILQQINDEIELIRKIKELSINEKAEESQVKSTDTKRTFKVTTDVLLAILKKANITALSDDKTKIAQLISYLTGFSVEKIRQRLSNTEELTSFHKEEVESINKILKDLNCDISIKYNKQR